MISSLVPTSSPIISRISFGITTWNLLETLTVFIDRSYGLLYRYRLILSNLTLSYSRAERTSNISVLSCGIARRESSLVELMLPNHKPILRLNSDQDTFLPTRENCHSWMSVGVTSLIGFLSCSR